MVEGLGWSLLDLQTQGDGSASWLICIASFIDTLGVEPYPTVIADHFKLIQFPVQRLCFFT